MPINNLVFVATDGHLDELARRSILSAAMTYASGELKIFLVSLDCTVPKNDPIFSLVPKNVLITVNITEDTLKSQFPNVMTKEFLSPSGEMISHWDNAKAHNQHLAEFSDLAIFSLMKSDPEVEFLYLDSDMISLLPIHAEKSFVVAYDEGDNGSLYINSSMIFVPKGFEKVKTRWIASLENEILDKYKFRYGMPGPVAFDKFLNRSEDLRGFKVDTISKDEINIIHYEDMYKATERALEKGNPVVIDVDHKGPLLNIPRSAISSALTHSGKDEVELALGVTRNGNPLIIDFIKFLPKEIRGIEYYERLKSK